MDMTIPETNRHQEIQTNTTNTNTMVCKKGERRQVLFLKKLWK